MSQLLLRVHLAERRCMAGEVLLA